LSAGGRVEFAGLPVAVEARDDEVGSVSVRVVAGDVGAGLSVLGVVFDISVEKLPPIANPGGGGSPVVFELDYSGLGIPAAGGLGGRLKLSYAFDCDVVGNCDRWLELDTTNDVVNGVLRAEIPSHLIAVEAPVRGGDGDGEGQRVFALAGGGGFVVPGAGTGDQFGDSAASQIVSLSSGQVGVPSGAAEASYSFPVPPVGAGPAPSLGLSYSSAVADGRHAGANGQDQFGTGWGLGVGAISRAYANCGGPIHGISGNRCLVDGSAGDRLENLSLTLNGVGSALVLESSAGSTHNFRLQNDPNWQVELVENSEAWADGIVDMAGRPGGGFWLLKDDGSVFAYGGAPFNNNPTLPTGETAVAIVAKQNGSGYWVVTDAGSLFDNDQADGSITLGAGQEIVDASASQGSGYRAVADDGQVFNLDGATTKTITVTLGGAQSVVGFVSSSQADGFWLVTNDGEVFDSQSVAHHGDAVADPNIGAIVDIASSPDGSGYWLLGDDGGVFTYGAGVPFHGSAFSWLNSAPVALAEDREGGYWVAPDTGRVNGFGGADPGNATEPDFFRSQWTVTTPDGTKYRFGSSNEPTSNARTESVQTHPVYLPGEGCVDDLCDLGFVWNLDGVEDVHGNAITYFYDQANNYYRAQLPAQAFSDLRYTAASDLVRVEYGFTAGSEDDVAPFRVHLDYEYRCAAANGCTDPQAAMPDVPAGLGCAFGVSCTVTTPSFFTRLRLSQVTTETVSAGGTASPVNQWDLSYAFPATGDQTPSRLWLDSISQTGRNGPGPDITLPSVTYGFVMLANRINAPAAGYNSTMPRLASILNEYGGLTEFVYFQEPASKPQHANPNQPCFAGDPNLIPNFGGYIRQPCDYFPAWAPNITQGLPGGFVLWHKYKVETLTLSSNFGATPALDPFYTDQVFEYSYSAPVWAYSDNPTSYDLWDAGVDCNADGSCNHWNDFRGHTTVTVTDGTGKNIITSFSGLDGDPINGQGPTPLAVSISPDVGGGSFVDEPWLAGRQLERARQSLGSVNQDRSQTLYGATVTAGSGDAAARRVHTDSSSSFSYIQGGGFVESAVSYVYDANGNETRMIGLGDLADGTDDYNVNSSWSTGDVLVLLRSTRRAGVLSTGAVVEDVEFQYDNGGWAASPAGVANLTGVRTRVGGINLFRGSLTYDSRGRVLWSEDGLSNRTSFAFESRYGHTSSVTNPLSQTTAFVTDPGYGTQLSVTDPDGDLSTTSFDSLGRLITSRSPGALEDDQTITYVPNPNQNLPMIVESDALLETGVQRRSWEFLDGFGRTMQAQLHVDGTTMNVTTSVLGGTGRTQRASAPFAASQAAGQAGFFVFDWADVESSSKFAYGPRGNATLTELVGLNNLVDSSTQTSISGRTTTVTNPAGDQWLTTLDGQGRVESIDEPTGGGTQTYSYDPAGRMVSTTDDAGNQTSITYNIASQRLSIDDPDSGTWQYQYDAVGNLKRQQDGLGNWTGLDYDDLSRLTRRYKSDAAGNSNGDLATFVWDPTGTSGALASSTAFTAEGSVTITNSYDSRNRPTRQTWNIPGLPTGSAYLASTFTAGGLLDTVDLNGTETLVYTYDLLGRQASIDGDIEAYASDASYSPSGRLLGVTSGATAGPNRVNRTWGYDPATLRVSSISAGLGGSTTDLVNTGFTFDDRGNVTRVTDVGQGEDRCFGYDALSRLMRAYASTNGCDGTADVVPAGNGFDNQWAYDAIGNITSATGAGTPGGAYSYTGSGGPHAVNTAGSTSLVYDVQGNLTSRTAGGDAVFFGYDWDNRLVTAGTTVGGDETASFLYDANGARVRRRVENGPVTTFYIGGVHEIEVTGDIAPAQTPTPATPIPNLAAGASALLLVGEDAPLTAADQMLHDRLTDLGFAVTDLDDDDIVVGSITGFDVIMLSATIDASDLGTTFKTLTTPLINMKPFAQQFQLGMVETEGLAAPSVDLVTVTDPGSVLAAGYSGTQFLMTDERAVGWGLKPAGSDMKVVAVTPDGKPSLYWYTPGDNMATELGTVNTAPACRVQFPGHKTAADVYSRFGWDLFDQSVWWAVSSACTFAQPQPESTTTAFCQTDTPPASPGLSKHWVSDILVVGDTAYVTGKFNQLIDADGVTTHVRGGLGACDLTTGDVITSFPDFDLDAEGLTLATDGTWLYVGGAFTEIGGNTNLSYLARINLATKALDTSWDPNPNKKVWTLEFNNSTTKMFVGGNFTTFGPNNDTVERLVKINLSDASRITGFAPNFDGFARIGNVWRKGAKLYIGGDFTAVADSNAVMQPRTALAAVDTTTGAVDTTFVVTSLDDHNPLEGPGAPEPAVEAVFEHDGSIYACGDWWTIDGQGQTTYDYPAGKSNQYNVGRFDPTTGAADRVAGAETYTSYPDPFPAPGTSEAAQDAWPRTTVTFTDRPWGPRNDGGVAECIPDPTSGLMYVAGHWDFVTGPNGFADTLPIGKIIAVDLGTGSIINTWDAQANSIRGLDALAVIPGEAILLGGAFTQAGGQPLEGLARFNLLSASELDPPTTTNSLNILFVVGDAGALGVGDAAIEARLTGQGSTVTVIDDNALTAGDGDGKDVVLVSQSVSSGAVGTTLTTSATPIVVWKPSLYDDFELTAAGAHGTTTGQTDIDIVDPAHLIAAGLTGTVSVYTAAKKTTYGTPGPAAAIVADTAGGATTPVIFTYDKGDLLASGNSAAGPRAGFYFDTNGPAVATTDGWALFDATLGWANAQTAPVVTQRSTIVFAGQTIATRTGTGDITWIVTDQLGSPTATISATGGTASVGLYYPYGQPRTGPTDGTGLGFTGQQSDLETGTGLLYYNARYYDPAIAKFTQPDSIVPGAANPQNFNRYAYVTNNPVSFTDPTGNCVNPDGTIMTGYAECDPLNYEENIETGEVEPTIFFSQFNPTRFGALTIFDYHLIATRWAGLVGETGRFAGDDPNKDLLGEIFQRFNCHAEYCETSFSINPNHIILLASVLPILGEVIDGIDCANGSELACASLFIPYGSGRAAKVVNNALDALRRAPTGKLDDVVRLACSFSAETGVLMADGTTTKSISQIEIGDWVLAEDPETGERGARQVTRLWVHEDTLVDLEINGVDVTTTEDHPFWNATDTEWQRADALDVGDFVVSADGDLLAVEGIDWASATTATAYNLTINDLNTYYVEIGDEQVLVHNQCGPNLGNLKKMTPSQVERGLGMTPHEFKNSLDLDGPISRFDIYRDGADVYVVEKSTGLVIETGEALR